MDRSEYMSVDADYWYDRGEEDERRWSVIINERTADDIEAGEHLK